MSLMINQNITSLNAWRNLNQTDRSMSSTMEKLSSGLRINKAADDPSGLVISEQMRAQVVGLKAAIKNSEKGVSMIQTAEGALDKVHALLDKMRGLALDSANNATSDTNMLAANQAEIDNILDTITRISDNTQYGTKKLLNGDNWSAKGTLSSTVNNAGVSSLADSEIAAGTTGPLTVTVGTLETADSVSNGANTFFGSNVDWGNADNGAEAAGTLARGGHSLTVSGALDSVSNDSASASTWGGGTWTTANSTLDYAGTADQTYTVKYEGTTGTVGTDTGTGNLIAYDSDGNNVGSVLIDQGSAGAKTLNIVDADGATVNVTIATDDGETFTDGESFTVNVEASTLTASLDDGTAVQMNRAAQTAGDYDDYQLTSGDTGGGSAYLNLGSITSSDAGSYSFSVVKDGDALATLGDGTGVAVYDNATDITLIDGTSSVTLDFGTIAAGATQIDVEDASLVFQVGANEGQTVNIGIQDVAANKLSNVATAAAGSDLAGVTSADNLSEIDVTTADGAQDAITLIDAAIDEISVIRGDLGAFQANTLEANLDSLRVSAENLQASESIIRDTDMAAEMADFTKYQIMMQAGTAMLAQANQMPQNILQLLG